MTSRNEPNSAQLSLGPIYNCDLMAVTFRIVDRNVRPDPRMTMVLYVQDPKLRMNVDDQGLNFLDLPREIRDNIYSKLCVKPTRIGAESKFTVPFWKDAITWRHTEFAVSCHQIWRESFQIYLEQNGFEFYFIRPFLEFIEKIGIKGRQVLRDVRWHNHARSMPFIVIRYLRSCTRLHTLDVFVRVTVKGRPGFWYGVPLLNAKKFFLEDYNKIQFGEAKPFGKGIKANEVMPDFRFQDDYGDYVAKSLITLSEALRKVKWEVIGNYKR